MREGRLVTLDKAPGIDEPTLRLYLRGPVLAVLLRQRGYLVLHASAVAYAAGAVAFLGASGRGKSTLAAALHGRGLPFIADDFVAIDWTNSVATVLPGVPELKLWPDTAAALNEDLATLPRVRPDFDKRVRTVSARIVRHPIALRRVFVLDEGPCVKIEPLAAPEALIELLRHSYGPRTLQHVRREEHFRQCAQTASEIPVARLRVPRDFTLLDDIAGLIERDCASAP